MTIRARAPLRISFGGGGTDVSPYCDERGGAVLSASIDRYAYATLDAGGPDMRISSLDYDSSVACSVDDYQIAEKAYQIERIEAGIGGGHRDQYATAFGGFNSDSRSAHGWLTPDCRPVRRATRRPAPCPCVSLPRRL